MSPARRSAGAAILPAVLLALAALVPSAVHSAGPAAEPDLPPVLQRLERQGFDVFGRFDAPGGMTGFTGLLDRRPTAVYLTPDGRHAIVGRMIDEQGSDVGAGPLAAITPEALSQRTWSRVEASRWVADGRADAPRIVYVFTDPNCGPCRRFRQAARPWVDGGNVQLRHMMVGLIGKDSPNKAAAILLAPSPSQALADQERDPAASGLAPGGDIPEAIRLQLEANARLLRKLGFSGTPGIVYRDANGRTQRVGGVPGSAMLATMLGPK